MICYKVVTKTADPNVYLPWFINGPGFSTLKYRKGHMTIRQPGWGPLGAFLNFYDALQLYHKMPKNLNDTPMAVIKCDGRSSNDRGYWAPGNHPIPQSMGESYFDSLYVIEEMPTGGISSPGYGDEEI